MKGVTLSPPNLPTIILWFSIMVRVNAMVWMFLVFKPKKQKKSKSKSKTTAYSYVSEINGEIKVHKTWEECKARVNGVAARFKKSVSPADEEEIIREFTE